MPGHIYLKGKELCVLFDDEPFMLSKRVFFEIGHFLFKFLWTDLDDLNTAYSKIVSDFMFVLHSETAEAHRCGMTGVVKTALEINKHCPYFYFFSSTILKMTDIAVKKIDTAIEYLEEQYPGSELLKTECCARMKADTKKNLVTRTGNFTRIGAGGYDLIQDVLMLTKDVVMEAVKSKRAWILSEVDFIRENSDNPEAASLTPIQKLYALDLYREATKKERPFYTNRPFISRYIPVQPEADGRAGENRAEVGLALIANRIAADNVEVLEAVDIENIDGLVRFELLKMLSLGIPFKKCKHCGCYFIPTGRSDMEYCPRVFKGETRPCDEIGSMRRYQSKVAENPVYEAFNKAYKRNNSRVRTRKMAQYDFYAWSEEARKKRDLCLAGELPIEDFRAWLDEGRRK